MDPDRAQLWPSIIAAFKITPGPYVRLCGVVGSTTSTLREVQDRHTFREQPWPVSWQHFELSMVWASDYVAL
jgi:hypothetical protein